MWLSPIKIFLFLLFVGVLNKGTIRNCPIEGYRKLQQIDDEVKDLYFRYIEFVIKTDPEWYPYFRGAGSMAEGGHTARLFSPGHKQQFSDEVNHNLELDLEIMRGTFPSYLRSCFEDISEKPGFLRIQIWNDSCFCPGCWTNTVRSTLLRHEKYFWGEVQFLTYVKNKKGFLLSNVIRLEHLNSNLTRLFTDKPLFDLLLSTILKVPASLVYSFDKVTKATSAGGFILKWNGIETAISWDVSTILKAEWKADITLQWSKRKRNWPPLRLLKESLKYTFIIAKPSRAEKNNNETTELRYSFSHIERNLIQLQSRSQRLIYLIFKSMFYRWINPLNPEQLSSYVCKSVMLWTCEEFPPDHHLWSDKSRYSVARVLRHLLHKLYEGFKNGYMPYFFNEKLNILENVSWITRKHAQRMLYKMKQSVFSYIPKNQEKYADSIEKYAIILKSSKEHIEEGIKILKRLHFCGWYKRIHRDKFHRFIVFID